jgi:hypothetical protein
VVSSDDRYEEQLGTVIDILRGWRAVEPVDELAWELLRAQLLDLASDADREAIEAIEAITWEAVAGRLTRPA